MPELPEVETVINDLIGTGLIGRSIVDVNIYWNRTVFPLTPTTFRQQLSGRRIESITRRAKYIVIKLDQKYWLLIHLRMTGRLYFVNNNQNHIRHEQVILSLDNSTTLRFHDTRKFGRILLTTNPESILSKLGMEPLEPLFTKESLAAVLSRSKRIIKPLLLDQTIIAGIGNIYADEALFKARIHPCRTGASLSKAETDRLHASIISVLKKGIRNQGTTLGSGRNNFYSVQGQRGKNREQLQVFRRTGLPCPVCKTPICRIVVGQRSTHICTCCQLFKPLC